MVLPPGNSPLRVGSKIYTLSADELADLVCSLGDAYVGYEGAFVGQNIDGKFLYDLKEEDIARKLDELKIYEPDHVKNLIFLLRSMKELAAHDSLPLFSDTSTSSTSDDDLEQIDVLFRAANALYQQGKLDDARTCYLRTMAGYERIHGATHPSYLGVANNLGTLLTALENYPEAQLMFEKALEGREATFGSVHIRTLNTCHHMGEMLKKWAKRKEAMGFFIRCYEGYRVIHGAEHNDTVGCRKEVEGLAREMCHLGSKLRREGKMVRDRSPKRRHDS
jgi:tetratricopeptide (TPR) repeat protein